MGTLINDRDFEFFDHVAEEVACLAGTEAIVFQFEEVLSQKNPIYGESISRVYKGSPNGVSIPILFKSPDDTPMSGEDGLSQSKTTTFYVSRKAIESRDLGEPRIGDIWKVWGKYYDVTDSRTGAGRFSDTGKTIEYEVTLMRRTKAAPESVNIKPQPVV